MCEGVDEVWGVLGMHVGYLTTAMLSDKKYKVARNPVGPTTGDWCDAC